MSIITPQELAGLLERGQHRTRHDGVRASWISGCSWRDVHLARATSAPRSGFARPVGDGPWLVRPSSLHRAVGVRGSRAGIRRDHRYLRDGHDPGPKTVDALSEL